MHLPTLVNLQDISKTYDKDIVALKAINLNIAEQEIIGIVGANGSGKSTLLKVIAGSLKPEQGSIKIFQLDLQKKTEQVKKHISYISQDRALDPEMTGKELLSYFSTLYSLANQSARQRYLELVETFAMADFIGRRINSYSGGQAQRLHLAIGLIHLPRLLLLDEPTAALDPKGKAFFWNFIHAYQQQGHTIIIVCHELKSVQRYCSRVLFMDKGQLIADATPDAIIQSFAQSVLHIKVQSALKNQQNLEACLLQSIASARFQFKAQSVYIEIDSDVNFDQAQVLKAVLQVFQQQQLPVTECRWEEPGLENAYFKLTGEKITPISGMKNKQKGRGKQR